MLLELALGRGENGFSLVTLDIEGSVPGGADAYYGVYDSLGNLTSGGIIPNTGAEWGDNSEILWDFTNLVGDETIAFFVGDDNNAGSGYTERIAAGDFAVISDPVPPVPEPLTILGTLTAMGFGVILKGKK